MTFNMNLLFDNTKRLNMGPLGRQNNSIADSDWLSLFMRSSENEKHTHKKKKKKKKSRMPHTQQLLAEVYFYIWYMKLIVLNDQKLGP